MKDITGCNGLTTFEDCKAAMECYAEEHDDLGYTLEEFELVED